MGPVLRFPALAALVLLTSCYTVSDKDRRSYYHLRTAVDKSLTHADDDNTVPDQNGWTPKEPQFKSLYEVLEEAKKKAGQSEPNSVATAKATVEERIAETSNVVKWGAKYPSWKKGELSATTKDIGSIAENAALVLATAIESRAYKDSLESEAKAIAKRISEYSRSSAEGISSWVKSVAFWEQTAKLLIKGGLRIAIALLAPNPGLIDPTSPQTFDELVEAEAAAYKEALRNPGITPLVKTDFQKFIRIARAVRDVLKDIVKDSPDLNKFKTELADRLAPKLDGNQDAANVIAECTVQVVEFVKELYLDKPKFKDKLEVVIGFLDDIIGPSS